MKAAIPALIVGLLAPAPVAAQQVIRAKDGDVILVEDTDKVKVVRRRHANVRAIYNAEQRWVVILADWLSGPRAGDGQVDWAFSFREITGDWPLGARWEGTAFIDQYDMAGEGPNRGLGLTTGGGLLQLLGSVPEGRRLVPDRTFADPSAMATVTFRGAGGSMMQDTFDIAEQRELTRMAQEAAGRPVSVGPAGARSSLSLGVIAGPTSSDYPPPAQPVRVGGNIKAPVKIKDVEPEIPAIARQAGVHGMVILEIVVGVDGTVQQAKVLRSIPLLDEAAIAAVKQWVFEPTHLNGAPVPVIMTVTVNFR